MRVARIHHPVKMLPLFSFEGSPCDQGDISHARFRGSIKIVRFSSWVVLATDVLMVTMRTSSFLWNMDVLLLSLIMLFLRMIVGDC